MNKKSSSATDEQIPSAAARRSYMQLFWRQIRKNRMAMAALVIIILLYLMAVFAPYINEYLAYNPRKPFVGPRNASPSLEHIFGTDHLGRDLFSRIVAASRISLTVGLLAAVISVTIGVLIGSVSAFYGGVVDTLLMRFTDVVLSFPFLFFAITIVTLLSPNFFNIVIAIAVLSWTSVARIVRANILSLKERDYFLAARALGASTSRLIFRHLIPNTIAPIIVNATLMVAAAILMESGLSYLGLGVQPPTPSWGNMLMDGKRFLTTNIWYTFFPGFFIFITVMCINFLGDGLRDAIDPRQSTGRGQGPAGT